MSAGLGNGSAADAPSLMSDSPGVDDTTRKSDALLDLREQLDIQR